MKLYLLHPILVHFPIALLLVGLGVEGFGAFFTKGEFCFRAGRGLLWLGAAFLWLVLGAGLLAEKTAPHVPDAWEVLYDHKMLGFWTVGIFTGLALFKIFFPARFPRFFLLAWASAAALLLATAYHGGELVFHFGMGVKGG